MNNERKTRNILIQLIDKHIKLAPLQILAHVSQKKQMEQLFNWK